ncbi:fatty acid desaturase [Actinospica robiniae]|uniref:fatty acid desaturase n=1 Tax=Actinospica robiniae TaxID=304901 RepID=UPI001B7FE27A|nr:fatty acid desaturase [Actinospica robiniae]
MIHANTLVGLSYGWWNEKHNRHHAHPDEPGRDPDVDAGALAFTMQAAASRHGLGRFPSMPRANLKRARPLVRAYCARIGMPYRECGLFDSYRQAVRRLDAMGVIGSRVLDEAG